MKKAFRPWLLLVLLGILGAVDVENRQTYQTTEAEPQVIRFVAQHSLGPVDGTLQPVRGQLTFDPTSPTDGLTGRFTVDMASFDSGLGLRDRDMKNNYLEVEQYPEAVFVLEDARPTMLEAGGDTMRLATTGQLTLHGVTTMMPVQATLVPVGEGYDVSAAFNVHLPDFNIKQPKRFFMTADNDVAVEVALHLVPTAN